MRLPEPNETVVLSTAIDAALAQVEAELATSPHAYVRAWTPKGQRFLFCLQGKVHSAGALAEIGLPPQDIPLALFAFNLGIELGQLLLVAVLLALGLLWRRLPSARWTLPGVARLLPTYLIGTLAAYWCLERTVGLGG